MASMSVTAKKTLRKMTCGIDTVGYLAAADLLEELGQPGEARMWRRRAEWVEKLTEGVELEERHPHGMTSAGTRTNQISPPFRGVTLEDRFVVTLRRTPREMGWVLHDQHRGERSRVMSGFLLPDNLGKDEDGRYRRQRFLGIFDLAMRAERCDGAPDPFPYGIEVGYGALSRWLRSIGYDVTQSWFRDGLPHCRIANLFLLVQCNRGVILTGHDEFIPPDARPHHNAWQLLSALDAMRVPRQEK